MEATLGPFAAGTYQLSLYQQALRTDGSLGAPEFDVARDFVVQADPPPCTPANISVEPAFALAAPGTATYFVWHKRGNIEFRRYFVLANSNARGEVAPVVEYRSASDPDHYFLTAEAPEMRALDQDQMGTWVRTGAAFLAWPAPPVETALADVCRFYGSVSPGPNSHFYTAGATECAALIAQRHATPAHQPRWNYEGMAFRAKLPSAGACPNDAPTAVYRLYDDGFARGQTPHHRFTTSPAIYAQMQVLGWKGEGLAMCLR